MKIPAATVHSFTGRFMAKIRRMVVTTTTYKVENCFPYVIITLDLLDALNPEI